MREMMALTERPDVISLAGGLPDTSHLPAGAVREADGRGRRRVHRAGAAVRADRGHGARRCDCIVEVMAAEGTRVDPDEVIVTTGGQQVIDLVCKTLIDPGDVIVAEAPTYPGAVPTFSAYQADVEQIEMDADGMPIDALEATLDRLAGEGRRPKFIYTIPNFQNPGGVTMSLARRRRLVEVARERELLVLEDNPYGLLRYEGEPLPTLYSLDAQRRVERRRAPRISSSTSAPSRRSSPRACGSAGRSRRGRCSRSSTSANRAPTCAPRRSPRCSSPPTSPSATAPRARVARLRGAPAGSLPRRRDVMLEALAEHFGRRRALDATRRAGCSSGRRSTAHRHDRPAGAR